MSLGNKLTTLRQSRGLSQIDAAKKMGISNVVLNRYEKNERRPDIDTLRKLAYFYNSSLEYLLDYPFAKRFTFKDAIEPPKSGLDYKKPSLRSFKVPLLKNIKPKKALFSEDNIDYYIYTHDIEDTGFFFYLFKDISMINARIAPDDLILIHTQDHVENGDIAVVLINENEAIINRVYFTDENIILQPDNPVLKPLICAKEKIDIIGKVTRVIFEVK